VKLRFFLIISIILSLLTVFIPVGNASAYYNYAEYTTGMDDQLTNIYGVNNFDAQSFMTGGMSVPLEYINLKLYRVGSPGNISAYIYECDDDGKPTGDGMTYATIDGNALTTDTAGAVARFNISPIVLDTNMQYAVILTATSGNGSDYVCWKVDSSSPSYSGGTVVTSTDGGSTWTVDATKDAYFVIVGGPKTFEITDVRVFQNIFSSGDEMFIITYNLSYSVDPKESWNDLFSVFLLGKADRPIDEDGIAVTSIYLEPGGGNWQSTETIRLEGNESWFGSGGLRTSFTVSSSCYVTSSSLSEGQRDLYNWLLSSGIFLDTAYNRSGYFVYQNTFQELRFTVPGAIYFSKAVPGIASVVPAIAATLATTGFSWEVEDYPLNTSYQDSLMGMLGTKTNNAFEGLGNYLSVPGWFLKAAFAMFLYCIIASIVFLVSGNSIAAIILAIPVLGYGVYIGMIPLYILAIITFLAFIGMAYFLWLH
jgi:hypothetical protein